MTHANLNEEAVKTAAGAGEREPHHLLRGATIQGRDPRGFGIRVTATGCSCFVLNYRLRGREHRFTIGAWPDWSALKAVQRGAQSTPTHRSRRDPLEDRAALPATATITYNLDDSLARHVRNNKQPLRSARPMNTKVRSTGS